MSRSLDTSKFRSALLPHPAIERSELLKHLVTARGMVGLTLLRAPLGYGKSVLLAQLLQRLDGAAGFYRIDVRDNEPVVFLAHLHHLLVHRPLAEDASLAQAWAAIRTALDGLQQPYTLCFDDLHLLRSARVLGYLDSLLHHPCAQLQLVAASEGLPRLGLAHLRRDNRLVEIGQAQLALDGEQTQQLLQAHDPALDPAFSYRLQAGSEGWISGVLFWCAAWRTSRPPVPSPEHLERAVQLSYQLIGDFIQEELLSRLPPQMLRFIERTAVVNAFDLPLAAMLSGMPDVEPLVLRMQALDLFVSERPADRLPWQYHPALRLTAVQRLRRRDPQAILQLHQQAADELLEREFFAQAVYQYGRAKNPSALLATIERHTFDLLREGEINAIVDFLGHALRDTEVEHLNLALTEAFTLIVTNDVARMRSCMGTLARLVERSDHGQTERVMQTIGLLRSHLAWQGGNLRHGIDVARDSLERYPSVNAATAILLASSAGCLAALGRLVDAQRLNADALSHLESLGFRGFTQRLHLQAGQIELAQGQTDVAWQRFFGPLLQPPKARNSSSFYDTFVHLGQALVLMQRNLLDAARVSFAKAENVALDFPHSAGLALIFVHQGCLFDALGDPARAASMWDGSRRLARGFEQWRIYRLAGAWRVRHAVRHGDEAFVGAWLEEWQWCVDHYADEVLPEELLAYAWVQRHLRQPQLIVPVLQRLQEQAVEQNNRRLQLDLCVLQTTLALDRGALGSAFALADTALALACDYQFGQLLYFEGAALIDLLQQLLTPQARRQYGLERPLPAIEQWQALLPGLCKSPLPSQPLAEPITRREREVLLRMARGQANAQIAESLFVSLSTIKTHINNLFRKLDVADREQALDKARRLGLLG